MTLDTKSHEIECATYESGNFVNPRGSKIFTHNWTVADAKAIIVLYHGYSDHSHDRIADDAKKFALLGYSSFSMDHEGHGLSEGLRAYVPDFDLLVDDALYYLERVRESNPNKKIFLYGHSMGGAICLMISLRRPELADGIVLIAPMVKIVDSMKPHPAVVYALTWLAWMFPTWAIVPTEDLSNRSIKIVERREVTRAHPLGYNGRLRLATGLAILKTTSYLQDNLDKVSVPLMICHGTDDLVTDPSVSELLFKSACTKDKTLRLYEGMWHAITAEPEAHMVFQEIANWIIARSGDVPLTSSDVDVLERVLEQESDAESDVSDMSLEDQYEPWMDTIKEAANAHIGTTVMA